jgi:hypothetical protein
MPAAAQSQWQRCMTTTPGTYISAISKPKFHAAAFCPHGGDMNFRLPVGIVSKACAKGGFV